MLIKSKNKSIQLDITQLIFDTCKHITRWLLTLLLFSLFMTVQAKAITTDSIAPDKITIYKTIDDTSLSLHIFNPSGHQAKDNVPVIVFFFGGGWTGGTPTQFYEQSRYFAKQGIVAISAEYRINNLHSTTPFESVKDAKSAIRWVRQHAKELGINPNKIVASGGSAGGHVAACTDLIVGYEEDGEDVTINTKPNAMVLYNPVLDTTEKGYGMAQVSEKRKTDISPNHHIIPGIVPTIVFHGTADTTVPFENAERFDMLMKQAGNDCRLEAYEGKEHGFFNGLFFRGEKADKMVYSDIMEKSSAFLVSILQDDIKAANVFSDHMVLQRKMPVPVWGTASQGQKITLEFAGQKQTTITDENGKWQIKLDPLKASATGQDLIISGKNKIVISDVLVGEVWICSGQSNMQRSYAAIPDIAALVDKAKHIRSFEVKRTVSLKEEDDVTGEWSKKVPQSAVAFSFAYFLEQAGDMPIGIIHASWGSSSLEAWMPRDMTTQFNDFKTIMQEFDADTETQIRIKEILKKGDARTTPDDIFLRRQPNILYNAMIKPLAPFALRGLIWYQGERNTRYLSGMPTFTEETWFHRVAGMQDYGAMLKAWIGRYREEWKNEDMHFMVVMLPGYGRGTVKNPDIDPLHPNAESWAWMRESQLKALELPHTSVINTVDLGDVKDIHPKDKLPIGQRLALEVAHKILGLDVTSEGPILKEVEICKRKLRVYFTNAEGLQTSDGKVPTGFWIADKTMQWKPAKAKIKKGKVVLRSKEIKRPLYIRYAFSGKPNVNLVNASGLPAYPFRTDRVD